MQRGLALDVDVVGVFFSHVTKVLLQVGRGRWRAVPELEREAGEFVAEREVRQATSGARQAQPRCPKVGVFRFVVRGEGYEAVLVRIVRHDLGKLGVSMGRREHGDASRRTGSL